MRLLLMVSRRVDFNDPSLYANVDWASVFADKAGAAPAAATAAPEKVASAPKKQSGSGAGSTGSSGGSGFGGVTGSVANGNVDQYIGNVGSPYGSNIIKVASTDGYDYTITMKNANSAPISVIVWNKSGPDG